jgi:hypothetical protein
VFLNQTPDPEGAAVSLADGVQKSMAAMYSLQTALINARAHAGASPAPLKAFKEHRENFKAAWNSIIEFLQQCHSYTADYVSLCDYAVRRPPAECLPFFKRVLVLAKSICDQAKIVQQGHEKVYKELLQHKKKFSSSLAKVGNSDHLEEAVIGKSRG